MARLAVVPQPTYDALARVRTAALLDEGSLFAPDRRVWTRENLEAFHGAFVSRFDATAAQSLLKLRGFIDGAGDAVILLTAELLYAQQFFAALNSADKIRNVRQVLSWASSPVDVPGWAADGLSFGLGDDQSFVSDRIFHLAWLTEHLIALHRLDGERDLLASDPWRFRAFVHEQEGSRGNALTMREAWLYMMFPDTFENISSRDDKWHIREAFPHVLSRAPSDNVDADLLAIRWGLTSTFGEGFHFYSNDVAVNWRASSRTGALPDVKPEQVIEAIERFDRDERSKPEWVGWESNANYKFALAYQDRLYPPKHIVSLATQRLKSGFSGGDQTNRYLTERGFTIVHIRDADGASSSSPIPAAVEKLPLGQAPSGPRFALQHQGGQKELSFRAQAPEGEYPTIAVSRTKTNSEPEPEPPPPPEPAPAPAHIPSKREIVELLKREELLAVADQYVLEVEDRRVNDRIVDAVVRSKKARISDILSRLSRDRLKAICNALELDDSGREKIVLIERILGEHIDASEETDEPGPIDSTNASAELLQLLRSCLSEVEPGLGWPMNARLTVGELSYAVSIYVRMVGGSSRGNPLERRFQNPSPQSPIIDDPDRYELLLGVWTEQGPERAVIAAFDPYRRMDRPTRFSMFMPLALLEQAADTGFATHENARGETLYAFRPENIGRYVDAQIAEGLWQKTRPNDIAPKRATEPKPFVQQPGVQPPPVAAKRRSKPAERVPETVHIRPQVGMYSAFARLNYKPWFALAEFLDNSIQSFLSNRTALETAGHEGPLIIDVNLEDDEISITDRAGGIAWEHFPRAFSPATPPEDASGLSEFGLGMKAAACWFSKRWTVRTSALGESVERTVAFDVPQIARTGTDDLPIESRPSRESDHFTVITMRDLRVHPRGRTLAKIREHLASIYRVLTRDGIVKLRLTTGGRTEELNYDYPQLLEAPYFRHPTERSRRWRQEFEVELGDRRVTGWAGILEQGSFAKAGFSVFRRRRLIEGSVGETYKPHQIFGAPNSFSSLRVIGEMFVEGFDVTHTKDGIQWHGYEDEVLAAIHHQIDSPKMPLLDQAEGFRKRTTATDLPKNFGVEALTSTVDALSQEAAVTALRTEAAQQIEPAAVPPASANDSKPEVLQQRIFKLNVQRDGRPWEIHLELVRDAAKPFYSSASTKDVEGRDVITVQINLDHEFSVNHLNDNEAALQPLVRLVAALALGEKLARDAGVMAAGSIRQYANAILGVIAAAQGS